MSKVSIVIPCYFNELNVAETYKVLVRDVFEKRKDIEFEIVFVDDNQDENTTSSPLTTTSASTSDGE